MLAIVLSHIYVLLAILIAILGRNKTMGFWGYLFGSLVLTPVVGFILVMVSAERRCLDDEEEA